MLAILHEDNHLLILNKPLGVPVQPDETGDACLLDIGRAYIKEKYAKPGRVYLAPAHRLDRPVSGALALARTGKAAARMAGMFRERRVAKEYHALVQPPPFLPDEAARGAWIRLSHFILPGGLHANTRIIPAMVPGAKAALLEYRMAGRRPTAKTPWLLLEIRPHTGYKHQIRAQLAWEGMPVMGDFRYGPKGRPARPTPYADGRGVALHASRLEMPHPAGRAPLIIEAPWPEPFAAMANEA